MITNRTAELPDSFREMESASDRLGLTSAMRRCLSGLTARVKLLQIHRSDDDGAVIFRYATSPELEALARWLQSSASSLLGELGDDVLFPRVLPEYLREAADTTPAETSSALQQLIEPDTVLITSVSIPPHHTLAVTALIEGRGLSPEIILAVQELSRAYCQRTFALADTDDSAGRSGKLTERELECLSLTAEGLSERLIANRLLLSPHTVRAHIENAKKRLQARNKIHAVSKAIRSGKIGL